MKTAIRNGILYVEIPLIDKPRLSNTGKTYTLATTHGITETTTPFIHNGETKAILLNITVSVDK